MAGIMTESEEAEVRNSIALSDRAIKKAEYLAEGMGHGMQGTATLVNIECTKALRYEIQALRVTIHALLWEMPE